MKDLVNFVKPRDDENAVLTLITDVSSNAVVAVLQQNSNDENKPIYFFLKHNSSPIKYSLFILLSDISIIF